MQQLDIQIRNSTIDDIEHIFGLYRMATDYQKSKSMVSWPEFAHELVEAEVKEHRQWKMLINGQIACVWATTFTDPEIWEEKNEEPSVYIHRIATDPDFRGNNLVRHIVSWAIGYAESNDKQYVRMDTVGENKSLIKHYTGCGFEFLGLRKLRNTAGLPAHYDNATVSLFELRIDPEQ